MKVGDDIWYFDINRRVYPKPEPGSRWSSGGPIYREHWVKTKVVGETTKSWLCEYGRKCPKKGDRRGWAFSEAEINDDVYLNDHRHRIANAVSSIQDVELLRQVARLIGYQSAELNRAKEEAPAVLNMTEAQDK